MWLRPDWPAPDSVVALSSTREGLPQFRGASAGVYASFNLGQHVEDDSAAVAKNRSALLRACTGLRGVGWLNQVHGTDVAIMDRASDSALTADASITTELGLACGVLTADCVPVLFCKRDGSQVAAAHAGWRGLCSGVLVNTVKAFDCAGNDLLAWIGPAISQAHFEVGGEVYEVFLAKFSGPARSDIEAAFIPVAEKPGHYQADLYALVEAQLRALGVAWVGGARRCTFAEAKTFYSFRRDGVTGRQLSLIYIKS